MIYDTADGSAVGALPQAVAGLRLPLRGEADDYYLWFSYEYVRA